MVSSPTSQELVYDVRFSSVGRGQATATGVVHQLTGSDLAVKLHYLRAVYLFEKEAAQGLTTAVIKEAMNTCLDHYYIILGRFRRSEAGRPYIKCNDCGVRFVEARCVKTVEEWVEKEKKDPRITKSLAHHQLIGPELQFSPPVFLQVTRFQCGGISMGLSWAHVLGDAFSVSDFMNNLGRILASLRSNGPTQLPKQPIKPENSPSPQKVITNCDDGHARDKGPLSIKRVDPVGDLWITPNDLKMETFSLHIPSSQLSHLQEKVPSSSSSFEAICAIIWQCIAKIRSDQIGPKTVTICKNNPKHIEPLGNAQTIGTVQVDFCVAEAEIEDLAKAMTDGVVDETSLVQQEVERDHGVSDYALYGANLTFVDLGEADFHNFEMNEQKPVLVRYDIEGVEDKGVVLVLPEREDKGGAVVTITLTDNQMVELKSELKISGLLSETNNIE